MSAANVDGLFIALDSNDQPCIWREDTTFAASPLLWVPLLVAAEHILTRTERDLP